jgi:catechol 2,3-dioxygenase-like lactoylglutathione lyase family enzyme
VYPRRGRRLTTISGAHAIIYSEDAEADRAFFKDVLGFSSVDAGGGWLIFALPQAELAVHPAEPGKPGHELFLTCEDIDSTAAELEGKGVPVERPFYDERWGRLAFIRLPGGGRLGIYQPRHPRPLP